MSDWFGGNSDSPVQVMGTGVEVRPLMRTVYLWMTLGLLVTAFTAVFVVNTPAMLELALNRVVFFGAIIGELALVWASASAFGGFHRGWRLCCSSFMRR